MMTYPNAIDAFADVLPDGLTLNIFDADFRGIEAVTPYSVVTVDTRWAANLPGLAFAHLGSQYLWWTLLLFNGLNDPIRDVYPGVTLRIPDRDAMMTFLINRRAARGYQGRMQAQATTII